MKRILHLSSIVIAKGVIISLALVAVAPAIFAAEEELQTGITIKANNGKYVGRAGPRLIANRSRLDRAERFDIQTYDDGTVSLRCQSNGKLLTSFNGKRPVPDALALDIPGGEVVPALSGIRFTDTDTLQ